MRFFLVAAIAFGLWLPAALAGWLPYWVEFTSATTPPTPFQLQRASRQGIELQQAWGTRLRGLLMHPAGEGVFPALVLLHGCDGIQPFQRQWGADLVASGYVVLLVDSYEPRGVRGNCAAWSYKLDVDRQLDARGALIYLRGVPFVDPMRVGIVGWDVGGRAVLKAMDEKGVQQSFAQPFAVGVAFYPTPLDEDLRAAGPLLILLGAADTCIPPMAFELSLQGVERSRFPVRLEVVPDAGYHFDDPRYAEPVHLDEAPVCMVERLSKDMSLAYSPVARVIAAGLVRRFLQEHLPPAK